MRLGDDEKDYYRLGAAGLTAGPRAPGMSGPGGPSGPPVPRPVPGRARWPGRRRKCAKRAGARSE